nr:nitrite reductase small subunit NirD [Bradyrhizobium sp. LTSP885]
MSAVQSCRDQESIVWHPVCAAARVTESDPVAVKIGNKRIAVYRLPDGELSALDDVCPHEFALLSKGFVEDGEIECPLHQARFEIRSGKCHGPLADRDLHKFPVKVEGGDVYVAI